MTLLYVNYLHKYPCIFRSIRNYISKNRVVCEIIWQKYGRARQTTDENKLAMRHTKEARIQTLIMPNTYCFSTANVVM